MDRMTRKTSPSRSKFPNVIRPVVMVPSGNLMEMQAYKGSSGGTNLNGWNKAYYRPLLDPPTNPNDPTTPTTSMGSQKWELGENIMIWGWKWEVDWYTGLIMSPTWPVSSLGLSTSTLVLHAIAYDDSDLGIISSTTWTTNDAQNTNHTLGVPTFNTHLSYLIASGGSYEGPMNAIMLERTWSGTITTNQTQTGGPIFIDDIFYSKFGPVLAP